MWKSFALAITISTAMGAQARPRFEYRGVHLLDSIPAGEVTHNGVYCPRYQSDSLPGVEDCLFSESGFAGVFATSSITVVDRRIAAIYFFFAEADHIKVSDALKTRWGPPTSASAPAVQNRMGATFQNIVQKWRFADGVMELERYGADLTKSSITVKNDRLFAIVTARRECAAAKVSQKDLGGKLPAGCK